MASATYQEAQTQIWETIAEGVMRTLLRAEPGEKRVLIKMEAGRTYPPHSHTTPDEVFVVAGTCLPGTEPRAGSEGCTILVWNSGK